MENFVAPSSEDILNQFMTPHFDVPMTDYRRFHLEAELAEFITPAYVMRVLHCFYKRFLISFVYCFFSVPVVEQREPDSTEIALTTTQGRPPRKSRKPLTRSATGSVPPVLCPQEDNSGKSVKAPKSIPSGEKETSKKAAARKKR